MAYVPYNWTNESYVNPSNMNHIEQGIDARFISFSLNGGSIAIDNGYYMAIAMKNTSSNPKVAGITLIRIYNGALNYQVPFNSDGFANVTYSYSDGVLSTTGANNGNVTLIRLD